MSDISIQTQGGFFMTKLFSMKSLAFAGAAAFALTLAAAPQADAAETAKGGIEWGLEENDVISPDQSEIGVVVSQSAVKITNHTLEYYYATVKSSGAKKKWKAVSANEYGDLGSGNYIFYVPLREITKDKAVDVYISADADGTVQTAKPVSYKAAPKVKATLNNLTSGASIKVTVDGTEVKTGSLKVKSVYGGFSEYVDVADLADGDADLQRELKSAADFGGANFIVTYIPERKDTDDPLTVQLRGTGKLKVSATPKAPKVALKLAKGFSLKFKDTIKYRTFVSDTDEPETWTTGNGQALTMDTLFGTDHVTKTPTDDYVLNDTMVIQAKTYDKNQKKMDSKITTTTVYASTATPSALTNVKVEQTVNTNTKKNTTTTDASIKFDTKDLTLTQSATVSSGAVVTLQYYDSTNKKWKDVNTSKGVTFKSGKIPTTVYVRVKATDYAAAKGDKKASQYEAAGKILTIKLDSNSPADASTYDENGTPVTAGAISTK
jgi:hypothetical protein